MIKAGGSSIPPGIYKASVEYEGGECGFAVTFPETEEVITELGEIECVAISGSPRRQSMSLRRGGLYYADYADMALSAIPE